jgi:homoserine O-acetyltransferase
MLLPTSKTYTHGDFTLSTGETLPDLTIAYETWGTLNAAGDNAILLCHGYTNFPHAAGNENGWANNLIGPGKGIDTDKYFVVCANNLGSSYGTSSAATVNPATGKLWGPDFPKFTVADTVETQRILIDHLGIGQLKAVIGYSYGGHLTFRWGATHPDRMRALVPIAGVIKRATTPGQVEEIRGRYAKCAGWNGGHYVGNPDAGPVYEDLAAARVERLTNYGIGDYLADTLGSKEAAAAEIAKRAESWAQEFDANCLYQLYEAGIGSDMTPHAAKYRAPLMNVLADTDNVVDVALGQPTVDLLKAEGLDAEFCEIKTKYGHAGPMIDAHLWEDRLRAFLDRTP